MDLRSKCLPLNTPALVSKSNPHCSKKRDLWCTQESLAFMQTAACRSNRQCFGEMPNAEISNDALQPRNLSRISAGQIPSTWPSTHTDMLYTSCRLPAQWKCIPKCFGQEIIIPSTSGQSISTSLVRLFSFFSIIHVCCDGGDNDCWTWACGFPFLLMLLCFFCHCVSICCPCMFGSVLIMTTPPCQQKVNRGVLTTPVRL